MEALHPYARPAGLFRRDRPAGPAGSVNPGADIRNTVDATEAQRLVANVELFETGEAGSHDHVTFFAELGGAPVPLVEHGSQKLLRVGTKLVEPLVCPVNLSLLRLKLGMSFHGGSLTATRLFA